MAEEQLPIQGVLPVVSFERLAQTVDARKRAEELIVSLDFLSRASRGDGFIALSYANPDVLEQRYGPDAQEQVGKTTRNRNRFLIVARDAFYRAYQIGSGPTAKNDPNFMHAFGAYNSEFGGPRNQEARDQRRDSLKLMVAIEGQRPLGDSYTVTPGEELFTPVESSVANDERPKRLDTRERLIALRDDPRAGFLPATHAEKNRAITFLDYMDRPDYPANIGHQFQEVYIRQKKLRNDPEEARLSLVSIGFELGDYFIQATEQATVLCDLNALVEDCPNPRATLVEEIGEAHRGYGPLLRYMDILRLRETGTSKTRFDALRSHANRGPQAYMDKNKTVEDAYTGEVLRPAPSRHLKKQIETLTIRDVRESVRAAARNEERRAAFWLERLYDTRKHGAVWQGSRQVLLGAGLPLSRRKVQ